MEDKFSEHSLTEISLEEAIRNLELENGSSFLISQHENVTKTSVSRLKELLDRHNVQPNYELLERAGCSQSLFGYKVSVQYKGVYYSATGDGNSKKNAKHAAAKALLDKLENLIGVNMINDTFIEDSSLSATSSNTSFCGSDGNDEQCLQKKFDLLNLSSSAEDITSNDEQNQDTSKTEPSSILLLQDLLARHKIVPNYEFLGSESTADNSNVRSRVTFNIGKNNFSEIGIGDTRENANQDAAKSLIIQICSIARNIARKKLVEWPEETKFFETTEISNNTNVFDVTASQIDTTEFFSDSTEKFSIDTNIEANPIGKLQELCVARHSCLPTYDVVNVEGLPHQKQFTIVCKLGQLNEIGSGLSKKEAKRRAAFKMLKRLK